MLPVTNSDINLAAFHPLEMPSRSYHFDLDAHHIRGFTDQREVMKQAIYLIIYTERYQYPIYSWNYGAELGDLLGKPTSYVLPEIKRRVTEALLQDDRITGTDSWEFEVKRSVVTATFTVRTIWGDIDADVEVNV